MDEDLDLDPADLADKADDIDDIIRRTAAGDGEAIARCARALARDMADPDEDD